MKCEIVSIGNELLIGKIADTNSKWIIDQIVPHDIEVTRITIIKDDLDEISSTIRSILKRKPDYIFTSGGLGPTFDDMTLKGVAQALDPPLPLEINYEALEWIKERYKKFYPDAPESELMKPSRVKMATLPKGSIPLYNRDGAAPGVKIPPSLTNGKTTIICLPGVPSELKTIFRDHILPELLQKVKNSHFLQCGFTFRYIGESKFTEEVYTIVESGQYKEIWIKTHPKSKKDKTVELHLTSFSQNPEVPRKMRDLYNLLKEKVLQNNGEIIEEKPLED